MSMLEWAKNEIAIASKRERGDKPEDEWDEYWIYKRYSQSSD